MKKILSAVVAALLVVAMSVGAFASTYPLENEPMFTEKNGDTYIGTLVTSALTNAQQDFLRAWLESDTNMLCYSRNSSLAHGQIVFYIFSSDTVLTSTNVSTSDSAWGTIQLQSGAQYSVLSFDAVTGKQVDFCKVMRQREACPTVKCDWFVHKEKHKVYRIVRRHRKIDAVMEELKFINDRLEEIYRRLH